MTGMTSPQIRDALDPGDDSLPSGKVYTALMGLKYHGAVSEHTADGNGPLGMPMKKTYYRLSGPGGRVANQAAGLAAGAEMYKVCSTIIFAKS